MEFYHNINTFSINSNLILKRAHYRTNGTKTEYGSRHMVRAADRVVGQLFASKSTSWVLIALNAEELTELRGCSLHGPFGSLRYDSVFRWTSKSKTGLVHIDFENGKFQFEAELEAGEDGIRWGAYHHYYNVVLDYKSHFAKLYFKSLTESTILENDFSVEWERVESHYEADVATRFFNYDCGVENNGWKIVNMKISKRGSKWFHAIEDFNGYSWEREIGSRTLETAKIETGDICKNGFVLDGGMYFAKHM